MRTVPARISGIVDSKPIYNRGVAEVQIVFQNTSLKLNMSGDLEIRTGDYLIAENVQEKADGTIWADSKHLHLTRRGIDFAAKSRIDSISRVINKKAKERLFVRSKVDQAIHSYFREHGVIPVMSPAIVSPWPDGNTTPFKVSFYEGDMRLTISNLLYHQIMVSSGLNAIYELGKLFRQEHPSTRKRLAEFTVLEISLATTNLRNICDLLENLITHVLTCINGLELKETTFPDKIAFDSISYSELIKKCGMGEPAGAQLGSVHKQYIKKNFASLLWIYGFPARTRPFYTKNIDDVCEDFQLWIFGKNYLAAGQMLETSISDFSDRMSMRGQTRDFFADYLSHAKYGFPPMAQLGMGIERLLACLSNENLAAADFTWFPRYEGAHVF